MKQSAVILLLLALSFVLPTGCVLPFATPPARIQASGVAWNGETVKEDETVDEAETVTFSELAVDVRGSLQPWQWWDNTDRRFDFGIGYFGTFRFPRQLSQNIQHGPYLELSTYPWLQKSARQTKRLGIHAAPELVFSSQATGKGATVGLSFEWVGFGKGEIASNEGDAIVIANHHGEAGGGLQLSVGYRRIGDEESWLILASFVVRLPASMGILIAFP